MIEIKGKYGVAKIFTTLVEPEAIKQVEELLSQPFTQPLTVRMMPDIHAGKGCVVGTTMTIEDKVVPNLVGVDIGCGIFVGKISSRNIDFEKLDQVIRENVPAGFNVRTSPIHPTLPFLDSLKAHINKDRAIHSLGTLGGGNHFIEVAKDVDDGYYLLIHTGSRNLGLSVAKHHQKVAEKMCGRKDEEVKRLIEKLKSEGRFGEIAGAISSLKSKQDNFNKDLAYLTGENLQDYLHDVRIAQEYAYMNRKSIATVIAGYMGWQFLEEFQTIHNYIDLESMILRKGAVSAKAGEKLVIPMNMRDGSLICVGKGNKDWNESAPHGAGRTMSRNKARNNISMKEFEESMRGVFTTSVTEETLDEAPMAYKPMSSILENIGDTVEVVKVLKPAYNFKASEA